MEKILYASNRGIYMGPDTNGYFDDGNLEPWITNRIIKRVMDHTDPSDF